MLLVRVRVRVRVSLHWLVPALYVLSYKCSSRELFETVDRVFYRSDAVHVTQPTVILKAIHRIILIMAALWNRAGIVFLPCGFFFLSSFFFPSPNLSSRRFNIYHTSTLGMALVRIECRSEMYCTWLAGNIGRKNDAENCHCAPSHNFVGLYLRN